MVARLLSLGVALGLSTAASLGLSPLSAAQAAYPSWASGVPQQKRPQFRPWQRAEPVATGNRWRPSTATGQARATVPAVRWRSGAAPFERRGYQPLLAGQRNVSRKASPSTRGQELGTTFRPDGRLAADREPVGIPQSQAADARAQRLHAQFRPAPAKRRLSYEEIQAGNRQARPPAMAAMPYGRLAGPPLPGYGGYWPAW